LDVVRVAEHQHRAVGLVGDGRLGQRLVGDLRADDAVGLQVDPPGLQVSAVANDEAGVVEAGGRLAEQRTVAAVVAVQHDHELAGLVGEELADPAGGAGRPSGSGCRTPSRTTER